MFMYELNYSNYSVFLMLPKGKWLKKKVKYINTL